MFTKTINSNNYSSGEAFSYTIEANSLQELEYYSSPSFVKELVLKRAVMPRHRISVLNQDESVRFVLPDSDVASGGSYSENYQTGQRRSLSFSLYNNMGAYTPSINGVWANAKVKLECGLEIYETGTVLWFPKGIYCVTSASPSHEQTNKTVSIETGDKFSKFENSSGVLGESLEIEVGTEVRSIIEDILGRDDGSGFPVDPKSIIYHKSFEGRVTPLTLSFSAGDTYGNVLTQLAEILSAEMYYNSQGYLTFVPLIDIMQDSDKPVLFSYKEEDGTFQSDSFQFDFSQVTNQVYVVGANVDGHLCQAMRVNDDPQSPLCYQRIGYRCAAPINDSNITSDILAEERAEYELRKALIAKTSFSSSVFFNPLLAVNNLVKYTDNFFGLEGERMLITSLSYSLDYSGVMSLSGSNIRNLPFTIA